MDLATSVGMVAQMQHANGDCSLSDFRPFITTNGLFKDFYFFIGLLEFYSFGHSLILSRLAQF